MPVAGGPFHPEEYQALLHEATWKQIAARPYLWGKFVWNMFDFAVDDRNEGDTPGRNDKGMVSYDRQTKKDAFFWYKANWSSEPFVYITGRRFNPRTTATIDVKVYSNLDSVSLVVGGVALPAQTSTDHIFIFPAVPLAAGDNQVSAHGDARVGHRDRQRDLDAAVAISRPSSSLVLVLPARARRDDQPVDLAARAAGERGQRVGGVARGDALGEQLLGARGELLVVERLLGVRAVGRARDDQRDLAERARLAVALGERAQRVANEFLVRLGELARDAGAAVGAQHRGQILERRARAQRRFVEHQRERQRAHALEQAAARAALARREAQEHEPIGRQPRRDQRRQHRRRPRDRHHRRAGGDRGRDDAKSRVGEQRRARFGDQRDVLAGGEQRRDLVGARRFVGVVAGDHRPIVARGVVLRRAAGARCACPRRR